MRIIKKILLTGIVISLAGLVITCEKEGTAERAGKKLDQKIEQAKDMVDNSAEAIKNSLGDQGTMENAGEKIDQIAEDTKEKLNELAQDIKTGSEGTAEQAGEKIDQIVRDAREKMHQMIDGE
ncbi:MAG: hypothetical protein K9N46_00985 [Candidatus Marinimicrobia bacterium]|nr:hypothetical protein [Candidatus Neomarinimicrobiota bacterium]MCF7827948.1 hypothetical protein [Candidatus Neomarinimicrobiota bacterium]MCF7879297.1 hypothetical protein [Candidatus Neomarinimicrobiota bacterium]